MLRVEAKILIADDMSTMRKIIRKTLAKMGYTNVVEVENGSQCSEFLRSDDPKSPVEFVLCDWNMPDKTGIEILQQMRQSSLHEKTPFVMLTAKINESDVFEAKKAGATGYIAKPLTIDKLHQQFMKVD